MSPDLHINQIITTVEDLLQKGFEPCDDKREDLRQRYLITKTRLFIREYFFLSHA